MDMKQYDPYNQEPPKEKEYKVQYSSNNSGGSWWLKDEDWIALEVNGWKVWWVRDDPEKEDDRWLGALAKRAEKEFDTIKEALRDFEKITGQSVTDQGCNCCGPPHDFSYVKKNGEHDYLTSFDVISEFIDSKEELIVRLLKNV